MRPIISSHTSKKWWFRWIRTLSWFSFRYYWFVWLLFLICLGLLIWCLKKPIEKSACNGSAQMELIQRLEDQLQYCCDCQPPPPPPPAPDDSLHFPADYLVITYQFNASGGRDLDTQTDIFSPRRAGPLGYCNRGNNGGSLLHWSGDNTGYGVESCMIDLTNFGPQEEIKVNCAAFWYGVKNSGNMSLDIRAYKGGSMNLQGYQFVNTGGQQTANLSFSENVHVASRCQSTQKIGVVSYNKQTERLDFQPD